MVNAQLASGNSSVGALVDVSVTQGPRASANAFNVSNADSKAVVKPTDDRSSAMRQDYIRRTIKSQSRSSFSLFCAKF